MRFLLQLTIAYGVVATSLLLWQMSEKNKLISRDDGLRPDRPAALLEANPEATMRWKTLRREKDLQILLGDPELTNATMTAWQTRCGTFRFYKDPDAKGFIRVQAQLPDKLMITASN